MSYLVLALGAFLSLCGAFAIYAGYGIIEVERGWATLIAGSVAFSCGIVTLALGLILHRLSSLSALVKSGRGLPLPAESPAPPAAAGSGQRSWPKRSRFATARSFWKPREPISHTVRGTSKSDYPPQKIPTREGLKDGQPGAELPFEPGFAPLGGISAGISEGKAEEEAQKHIDFFPEAEFQRQRKEEPSLFEEMRTHSSPGEVSAGYQESRYKREEAREPDITWPAETVSIGRLFDEKLLSELDSALAAQNEAGKLAAGSLEPESHGPQAPPGEAAASPEPPEEPAAPSGTPQEELAIVGQYESEGTSYIMYSDGSIEARTEHAVFHFKSMAELKAFMESNSRD